MRKALGILPLILTSVALTSPLKDGMTRVFSANQDAAKCKFKSFASNFAIGLCSDSLAFFNLTKNERVVLRNLPSLR